jgi:hypothetical protein
MRYFYLTDEPFHNWEKVIAVPAADLAEAMHLQATLKPGLNMRLGERFLKRMSEPNDYFSIRFEHAVPDDKAGPFVAFAGGNMGIEPVWCAAIEDARREHQNMVEIFHHGRSVEVNLAWARERLAREEQKRRVT